MSSNNPNANADAPNANAPDATEAVAIQVPPPLPKVVLGAPTQAAFTELALDRKRCLSKAACDAIFELLKVKSNARPKKYQSIVEGHTDVISGVNVLPVKLPWSDWNATAKVLRKDGFLLEKKVDKDGNQLEEWILTLKDNKKRKEVLPIESHLATFAEMYIESFGEGTRFDKKLISTKFKNDMANKYYFNADFFFKFLLAPQTPQPAETVPPPLLEQPLPPPLLEQPSAAQTSQMQAGLIAKNASNDVMQMALTPGTTRNVNYYYSAPVQQIQVHGDYINQATANTNNADNGKMDTVIDMLHQNIDIAKDIDRNLRNVASSVKKQPGAAQSIGIRGLKNNLFPSQAPNRAEASNSFAETWSPASGNEDEYANILVGHPPDSPEQSKNLSWAGAGDRTKNEPAQNRAVNFHVPTEVTDSAFENASNAAPTNAQSTFVPYKAVKLTPRVTESGRQLMPCKCACEQHLSAEEGMAISQWVQSDQFKQEAKFNRLGFDDLAIYNPSKSTPSTRKRGKGKGITLPQKKIDASVTSTPALLQKADEATDVIGGTSAAAMPARAQFNFMSGGAAAMSSVVNTPTASKFSVETPTAAPLLAAECPPQGEQATRSAPKYTSTWDDDFGKPKPDEWQCKICTTLNRKDSCKCLVCNNPNPENDSDRRQGLNEEDSSSTVVPS